MVQHNCIVLYMDNILVSIQTMQFALHLNMFDTYGLVHLTCVSTQSHAAARYISLAVVRLEEVCLSVCSVFRLLSAILEQIMYECTIAAKCLLKQSVNFDMCNVDYRIDQRFLVFKVRLCSLQ